MKIANPFERFGITQADYDGNENYGRFVIEPLERGFGLTLGNALRRVLLSSLPGASIYAVEVEGARHEFTALPGVEEDVTTIILNLKDLVLKIDSEDASNKRLEINVTTSTPVGQTISLALTTAGPVTLISSLLLLASSLSIFKTKSFKFKMMVVTSSSTPGRAVNS